MPALPFKFSWPLIIASLIAIIVVAYVKTHVEESFQAAAIQPTVVSKMGYNINNVNPTASLSGTEIPAGKVLRNVIFYRAGPNSTWIQVPYQTLLTKGVSVTLTGVGKTITAFIGTSGPSNIKSGNTCTTNVKTTVCTGQNYQRRINGDGASPNPIAATDMNGVTNIRVSSVQMLQTGTLGNDAKSKVGPNNYRVDFVFQ